MATFYINGAEVTVAKKQKLLRYLRDELHLTSVKDGCSEGACGACTVLINGEPCRACVPDTERLDGKHILTVEGLSDFEKAAYTFAFGEAGAVQCGFCIPGMVLCAKALLDRTPDPTEEQIRWAIRNNYCRCTGYVKIIEAVKLAAAVVVFQSVVDFWLGRSRMVQQQRFCRHYHARCTEAALHSADIKKRVLNHLQHGVIRCIFDGLDGSAVQSVHERHA